MNDRSCVMHDNGKDSSGRMWWLCCLAWLAVACLLGMAQSATVVDVLAGLAGGEIANIGLLVLAREGVMLYGFGWSCLMGMSRAVAGSGVGGPMSGGERLLTVLWSFCVALGTLSVLVGSGSGVPVMPFAPWVMPALLVIGVLQVVLLVRKGECGTGMVPCVVALGLVWGCMAAGYWSLSDGVTGADGQFVVFGWLKQAWCIGAAMCGSALFLKWSGEQGWHVWVPMLLLAAYAGDSGSWYMPVAHGVWSSPGSSVWLGGGALLVVILTALMRGRGGARRLSGFWLASLCLWGAALIVVPDGAGVFQLSPMNWYVVDATLVLAVAVPLMTGCSAKWTRWCLGIGVVVFLLVFVFSATALLPGEYARGDKQTTLLDLGLVIVSSGYAVAWLLWMAFAMGEVRLAYRGKTSGGMEPAAGDRGRRDCSERNGGGRWLPGWVLPVVLAAGCVVPVMSFVGKLSPVTGGGGLVSKRPGADRQGAALYASSGCGVCHTQIVRRLPDGKDLQESVYQNGNGDGVARVSEPEDWSRPAGEGLPHLGWVRLGPDLFQLGAWAEQRVRFTNQDGQGEPVARPEEWLMLHLYNPRDRRFGRTGSLCPSLAEWFDVVEEQAGQSHADSLPIQSPPGTIVVPGEKIRHLVAYLRTLKRGNVTRAEMLQGIAQVVPDAELHARPFVEASYARNLPAIDTSRKEQALDVLVMQKGKQLYSTKCTLCHGADGRGDGVNYPPLEQSEWIAKEPSIMARIVRNGVTGKIPVAGKTWDTTMLPPGISSPEEAAAVMTYVRRRFGTSESPRISVDQVRDWWRQYGDEPYRVSEP